MRLSSTSRRQRGAGAVMVVMVLFFVVSLVAAYTNRNLIFEQKTSANQTRATMAFEAADAAIEWTLAQLNGGVIDANCGDATPTNSFQKRYLTADGDGYFTHTTRAVDSWPTCVFNGNGWTCRCPEDTAATPPDSTGDGPFPAFRVWPATKEPTGPTSPASAAVTFPRPAMISVGAAGCSILPSSAEPNCLSFLPRGNFGEGVGSARVYLALRSGLVTPPSTPVMARGTIRPYSATGKLKLVNEDVLSGGLTLNSGGAATPTSFFDARTVGGTPGAASFADQDARLSGLAAGTGPSPLSAGERMFVTVFGMKRQTYLEQPGLRVCPDGCTTAQVVDLLAKNPNRVIWVEGDLTVDANIGSPTDPVLLIMNGGALTLNSGVQIQGFVYMAAASAVINLPAGPTAIVGALAAEGDLDTEYAGAPSAGQELTITYDAPTLRLLRHTYGSWVRVVGGWRDFKE